MTGLNSQESVMFLQRESLKTINANEIIEFWFCSLRFWTAVSGSVGFSTSGLGARRYEHNCFPGKNSSGSSNQTTLFR